MEVYNESQFDNLFIHHEMVAIIQTRENKQSLTKENNYLRYCNNFGDGLTRISEISDRYDKENQLTQTVSISGGCARSNLVRRTTTLCTLCNVHAVEYAYCT